MERKIRKYTKEFRQESVHLALKSACISKTATGLGIPTATLHSWINSLKNKGGPHSVEGDLNTVQDVKALLEENRRLHKELAITREEREILKKAAAYFAQHQK